MPFLSGSLGFERFSVTGFDAPHFEEEIIEKLSHHASGKFQTSSTENTSIGFIGGDHLFDQHFDFGKNIIHDALHCGVRVDTNQVPAAIRKAWLQMEIAGLAKDNASGRPTKTQKLEAKEAVEARCEAEAATGKYRKMSSFSVLWDRLQSLLYFGGSGAAAAGHCADLFERAFDVELSRVTAGTVAINWAIGAGKLAEVEDLRPAAFVPAHTHGELAWANVDSSNPDFLGNEFILWLWWTLENETDTIQLSDESEVTIMLTKTLTLECPLGEHGKETISAESPVKLSEAMQAVRAGKLPRKTGMTLVRNGTQYDLVLQAESFAISGAKIHVDEDDGYGIEDRIDGIRELSETVDLLFQHFLARRVSSAWSQELQQISNWLSSEKPLLQSSAA